MDELKKEEEIHFKPYGTIAFILLLLLLTAVVWFSVYAIQIERF